MPMKRKKTTSQVVRSVFTVVFLLLFVSSGIMLVVNLTAKRKGEKIYTELQDTFYSSGFTHKNLAQKITFREDNGIYYVDELPEAAENTVDGEEDSTSESEEENESLKQIRDGLASLREINDDVYGWIFVENTDINYPIVKGEDNDFYLNHAYDGTYLTIGSIFADYRCEDSISENLNTVLYGHNLLTGGSDMFHDVEMFLEQEFFDSTYIYIYTFDGIYVYEPFSIYQARYDFNYFKVDFDSEEEFGAFLTAAVENSRHDCDVTFEPGDRILTLSTCTNIEYFTRYALHAKLIYRTEE